MTLTLETIFGRPQFTRFQSGFRLAALSKLAYLYNSEADDEGWLCLPNAAFKKWLGPNWQKRLDESQADGFANAQIGEEQTRWQPKPRFLTEAEATPAPMPRQRYGSDDPEYRAKRRQGQPFADSAPPPHSAPPSNFAEQMNTPQRTPHSPVSVTVSETVSETENLYKKNFVSETVSETAQADSAKTPQNSDNDHKAHVAEWRKANDALAEQSASQLDDCKSKGYHILIWNHARKNDLRSGRKDCEEGLFVILRYLADERKQTGKPQGKAWYQQVTKLFEAKGVPLVKGEGGSPPSPEELAEIAEYRTAMEREHPHWKGGTSP